jgi:CTP:molybdopterin cytidylyltransferase MocA
MKTEPAFSTVILAAGNSSRMNSPKSFLPFDDKRNFVEKIIDTYIAAGIRDIILIISADIERRMKLMLSNSYPSQKVELVVNRYPERGRFYSIRLGLGAVKTSSCFLQNIDNPFITMPLINEIMKASANSGYVVPAFRDKEGHPVLISNDIVKHLQLLEGEDHNLRNELKQFSKIKVNWPYENILANINTREEYMKYFLAYEVIYKKSA